MPNSKMIKIGLHYSMIKYNHLHLMARHVMNKDICYEMKTSLAYEDFTCLTQWGLYKIANIL